ncbi:hypothetical protein [Cesiribacter andamanensis]|uniref:Lipoprotein n=1 Tax=Cesiribacter andamanensis AMV16 TaxID=1279009 RepID=M7NS83_9BACT|nr:hypothetical protein [Cesiribacter andamanensis]EMR01319.1 hypothetical protein ADICEAN_03547 [Cesiribacter andamanensis AMV16]
MRVSLGYILLTSALMSCSYAVHKKDMPVECIETSGASGIGPLNCDSTTLSKYAGEFSRKGSVVEKIVLYENGSFVYTKAEQTIWDRYARISDRQGFWYCRDEMLFLGASYKSYRLFDVYNYIFFIANDEYDCFVNDANNLLAFANAKEDIDSLDTKLTLQSRIEAGYLNKLKMK